MKKSLRFICLTFVFVLIYGGITLMHSFPLNTQAYVEKKYAGWNGVLQAWVCSRWSPDGSFIQWLNRCASGFEKNHEGVYIEFIPVQPDAIHDMNTHGLPAPDLIFFSPGVISDPDMLMELQPANILREDLKNYGQSLALPVALGGYIWAYNTERLDDVPQTPGDLINPILPTSAAGQNFSAALLGLLSATAENEKTEFTAPDSGIDLGLPTSAASDTLFSENALNLFMDGGLSCIPVDARSLARIARLSESGRGPNWKTSPSGEITCTDQILLAAIPIQVISERRELAQAFISMLLAADSQAALADIGAFSATGESIHSSFSIYAEMDILLNSRSLWLPGCFSEYSASNSEAIVRRFFKGELSAKNALRLMGFEGM